MRLTSEYLPILRNAIKHDTPFTFDGHTYDVTDRDERNDAVQTLLNVCYYDDAQLDEIAFLLLYEEMTDSHPDKMTNTEHPFYSDTQLARRKHGIHRKNDGRGMKEVPLWCADNVATDGKDYSFPKRRKRDDRENRYIDEVAISRNKERRLHYRKFLRGELDGQFTVKIATGEIIRHKIE